MQLMLWEGILLEEMTCTTMILPPKGKGDCWGIGMVEVIFKMITTIINTLLRTAISLHDAMYGFSQGRGVATYTLEDKMEQRMTGIFHGPLLKVFFDAKKAYKSLDQTQCTEIELGNIKSMTCTQFYQTWLLL